MIIFHSHARGIMIGFGIAVSFSKHFFVLGIACFSFDIVLKMLGCLMMNRFLVAEDLSFSNFWCFFDHLIQTRFLFPENLLDLVEFFNGPGTFHLLNHFMKNFLFCFLI